MTFVWYCGIKKINQDDGIFDKFDAICKNQFLFYVFVVTMPCVCIFHRISNAIFILKIFIGS